MNRLLAIAARRDVRRVAVLLALLLTLPAIGVGLFADDYLQRSVLLGVGTAGAGARPIFDMFAFVPFGARHEAVLELGSLTWWAHPELSVALFRPLAILTHVLDYRLWPDAIPLQHMHSLAWYALAVFAVAAFYRRVHGATAVAGLAALLFAVEDAHAMCVGWLANRHALVTLAVGMLALHAHVRRRRGAGRAWGTGAVLGFTAALFCGESALGIAAYIAAWQATMEDGSWSRRLRPLLPYVLVVVAWRVLYTYLGYGTHGTALYIDPARHPAAFLVALAQRWPLLHLAQWLQIPVDFVVAFTPRARLVLVGLAVTLCFALVALFGPLLARRREARFWALGMSLAIVPLCAAFPMDRLLLLPGIGAFGLLALLAEQTGCLPGACDPPPSRRRKAAGALLVLHGPVAAVWLLVRTATLPVLGAVLNGGSDAIVTGAHAPRQTYVFVTGHEFPVVYFAIRRQLETPATAPKRVALLSSITNRNTVYRESRDTLVIDSAGGFLRATADQLLRSLDRPFHVGERIARRDFTAEVRTVTEDGRPRVVEFRFRAPLESSDFRWFAWSRDGPHEFPLPPVGGKVEIPPVAIVPGFDVGDE